MSCSASETASSSSALRLALRVSDIRDMQYFGVGGRLIDVLAGRLFDRYLNPYPRCHNLIQSSFISLTLTAGLFRGWLAAPACQYNPLGRTSKYLRKNLRRVTCLARRPSATQHRIDHVIPLGKQHLFFNGTYPFPRMTQSGSLTCPLSPAIRPIFPHPARDHVQGHGSFLRHSFAGVCGSSWSPIYFSH